MGVGEGHLRYFLKRIIIALSGLPLTQKLQSRLQRTEFLLQCCLTSAETDGAFFGGWGGGGVSK